MSAFEINMIYDSILRKFSNGVELSFLEKNFFNAYMSLYFYGRALHFLDIKAAKELQKKLQKNSEGS